VNMRLSKLDIFYAFAGIGKFKVQFVREQFGSGKVEG